jgi:hypothetical protein
MISSWKSWLNEDRTVLSLCSLGIVFGLAIGYFIKDWAGSFHSIEIFGYQITPLISFGIAAGLSIQAISILFSWVALSRGTELYFDRIICILIGVPMGVEIVLNIFSGYLVALGFIIPYILSILLNCVVMTFVGWHTMHLFWFNAISLLPLYLVLTGITWLIEFCRSIV